MDDKINANPKVFLSYSQKYTPVMRMFKELLRAMDLEPVVFDYGAPQNPTEKQKELISESDGVIGLLTPDEETIDGKKGYSRRVNTEISMAYANDKKIQLIAINNPDLSGLPYQTNTVLSLSIDENQSIDQESLPKLFKTLRDFEIGLREIVESKSILPDAPTRNKLIDFTQTIVSDQELIIQAKFNVITLKSIESRQYFGSSYCKRKNNQTMVLENGVKDIDFRLFEPKGIDTELQLFINEPSQVKYRLLFKKKLEAGTILSYGYRRRHKNYIFYTYEELEEGIKENRISNLVMRKEKKIGECFETATPTDRLKITLEFPDGYPIKNVSPIVMMRDEVNKAETERIKELLVKEDDPFRKTSKLSIDIPKPKLLYSYFLLYEPPKLKEIEG